MGRNIGIQKSSSRVKLPSKLISYWKIVVETYIAAALFLVITTLVYARVGFANITNSYRMWFEDGYWVNYNVVEALAWVAKAAVILPGLIWQQEIWQLHIVTLLTSALLIWVSERKLLPTMVAFNTLWIGLSSVVIVRNLI
jgi:hypothetical protein